MAKRVAPEFQPTRIIRPVAAPVDTFFNLSPIVQSAPIDTQSLEIAEALQALSPTLAAFGAAYHSSEFKAGVEEAKTMTPEEREAWMKAEQNGLIMPARTQGTLEEIGYQLTRNVRTSYYDNAERLMSPFNADGTPQTLNQVQSEMARLAGSVEVPDSYYIRRGFQRGLSELNTRFLDEAQLKRSEHAQKITKEQFSTRVYDMLVTSTDPETFVESVISASDRFYESGLIPDGARNEVYQVILSHATNVMQSPNSSDVEIERMQAIIGMLLESQTEEDGTPLRGIAGMPMPPAMLGKYEALLDALQFASDQRDIHQAGIETARFSPEVAAGFVAFLYANPDNILSVNDPNKIDKWIEKSYGDRLSDAGLMAIQASLRDSLLNMAIRAMSGPPPNAANQIRMNELATSIVQGRTSRPMLLDMLSNGEITADQYQELSDLLQNPVSSFISSNAETVNELRAGALSALTEFPYFAALPRAVQSDLVRDFSRRWEDGVAALSAELDSPEMQEMLANRHHQFTQSVRERFRQLQDRIIAEARENHDSIQTQALPIMKGRLSTEVRPELRRKIDEEIANNPDLAESEFFTTIAVDNMTEEAVGLAVESFFTDPRPFEEKIADPTDFTVPAVAQVVARAATGSQKVSSEAEAAVLRAGIPEPLPTLDPSDFSTVAYIAPPAESNGLAEDDPLNPMFLLEEPRRLRDEVFKAFARWSSSGSEEDAAAFDAARQTFYNLTSSIRFDQTREVPVAYRKKNRLYYQDVPMFVFKDGAVYTLPESIAGKLVGSSLWAREGVRPTPGPLGGPSARLYGFIEESDFNNIDDFRVKNQAGTEAYVSLKGMRFGSVDQLDSLQTDEGVQIAPYDGSPLTPDRVSFNPATTRFFNSREELEAAYEQYQLDSTGPLAVIHEYVEYKFSPESLYAAQRRLVIQQVPYQVLSVEPQLTEQVPPRFRPVEPQPIE